MLRVLQVLHTLSRAGTERLVYDLAMENRRWIDTAVICLDGEGPLATELRRAGVPVYATHRRNGLDFRQVFRIGGIIREFGPGVIHCHQYTPFFYGCLAAAWAGRGRVVFTEHGRHFPDVVGWKRRAVNRFLARRVDRMTAVCQFSKDRLVEKEGLPAERIEVVYNGVDCARFGCPVDWPEVRGRLGIPAEALVIVQVGTFRAVKDQATAVGAFKRVRAASERAHLVFVGEGPDLADCRALAANLGLDPHVQFLGLRSDIPAILAAADILLMTSRSEAHSVAVLEAMAAGLPVVATRVGGNPETIIDGETGFLADPGDAEGIAASLVRLLGDDGLRARMGRAGRRRVETCFPQAMMHERYLAIYRELAEKEEGL